MTNPYAHHFFRFLINGIKVMGNNDALYQGCTVLVLETSTFLSHHILHPKSSILHPTPSILRPTYCILHPTFSILHPVSYIQHPASCIQHPTSSIQHKILSNAMLSNKNTKDYISRNQNTMLTNDTIIYFLCHSCKKEKEFTLIDCFSFLLN